ncbi:MAG TPA: hypothetical protein VGN20_14695 [Mucilaginibacter sp.]|jgi:hypothetical protein
MAWTYIKGIAASLFKAVIFLISVGVFVLQSCKSEQKTYKSDCNDNITFKRVGFTQLVDSIKNYDQKYIEVDGTYKEGKDESALINDSSFVDHSNQHSLWVNFSQDCPLYLAGTHTGLFEYNDGNFTQINNKKITIRGKVDVRHKGHLGSYKGTIDRVSFVKL